jgi:hypothetical protein
MPVPERFPDPDPLLRFVADEELPMTFSAMPPEDRWRRLRLYLLARAANGPHYPIVNLHIAFDATPDGERYAKEVVDPMTDAAIEERVEYGIRRWREYDAFIAAGGTPSLLS